MARFVALLRTAQARDPVNGTNQPRPEGNQDDAVVLDFSGTVPNTFGAFRTVLNDQSGLLLDRLYIRLTNPFLALGGNPVGMDNIIVARSSVPEPAMPAVLLAAAFLAAGMRRRA